MNIESVVKLSLEIDGLCSKYGYKLSEEQGQTIYSDYGKDGGLTPNYWLRIEPKTQETQHDQEAV